MGMRSQGFTLSYCLAFPPGRKSDILPRNSLIDATPTVS